MLIVSRRRKPVKDHIDPQAPVRRDAANMRALMADSQEDAAEWRRLAESTDVEWIYEVCMSKARGCDQNVKRWQRQINRAEQES